MDNTNEKPTYWIYVREIIDNVLSDDPDALTAISCNIKDSQHLPFSQQHAAVAAIFDALSNVGDIEDLALQLGTCVPLSAYSNMIMGFRIAPICKDAISMLVKYHDLSRIPLVHYDLDLNKNAISINFKAPMTPRAEALFCAAAAIHFNAELSKMTGSKRNLTSIGLRDHPTFFNKLYLKHVGILPHYDTGNNTIVISNAAMNSPIPDADPETFKQLIHEHNDRLNHLSLGNENSTEARIREIITINIEHPPGLSRLEELLNIPQRQIRSSLARAKTSYRSILSECRLAYVSKLLKETSLPISTIAYQIGYADVASFNHSFKRWTGMSPRQYQQELRG
jgi:AraC-like DNA-binding protein